MNHNPFPQTPTRRGRGGRPRISDPGPRTYPRHNRRGSLQWQTPRQASGAPPPGRQEDSPGFRQALQHQGLRNQSRGRSHTYHGERIVSEVDSMSLQVLEKADGTKLGLRIVDDSALSSPYSSIFSSLPLSAVKNGFAFRAHTVQAATNIFRHAKNGTEPVVGIMFTPPHIPQNGDDVVAHNVGWECLARPAPKINEDDGGFRLSELNKFLPEIPAPSKGKQK